MDEQFTQVSNRTLERRKLGWFVIIGLVTLGMAALTALAKSYAYFPFDLWVTRQVQLIDFVPFDVLMKFISWIGNHPMNLLLPLVIAGLLSLYKHFRQAVMLLVSTYGAVVISTLFKVYVGRIRPDSQLIHQTLKFAYKDSFPSGHVLFYLGLFGFLMYLSYALLPRTVYRKVAISVCGIMIFLVGLSRIYLGAHWFSDVLGAYLLGFLWLNLVVYVFNKWRAV